MAASLFLPGFPVGKEPFQKIYHQTEEPEAEQGAPDPQNGSGEGKIYRSHDGPPVTLFFATLNQFRIQVKNY
jgi:hypothetical protein